MSWRASAKPRRGSTVNWHPSLGAGLPKSYGSQWDPLTGRYVIVLEDMAIGPCEFPDTLHPLDTDKIALLVEMLGHLHGTFWGRLPEKPRGGERFGWLWSPADPSISLTPHLMRLSARRLAHRTSIPVDACRFIWQNFEAATAVGDAGPHTVLHGDFHPGNTYFRNGRAGLLDWQVVRRGHPSRDLAYTLVLGMTTAYRQASQRHLIDAYRKSLAANGGPELDRDDLWNRYRQAAAYAFGSPLCTAGLGGLQTEEIALEGLKERSPRWMTWKPLWLFSSRDESQLAVCLSPTAWRSCARNWSASSLATR